MTKTFEKLFSPKYSVPTTNKWLTVLSLLTAFWLASCSGNRQEAQSGVHLTVGDTPAQVDRPVTGADITNYKQFPSRNLKASPAPFTFTVDTAAQLTQLNKIIAANGASVKVENYLKASATVAFLVIKDDKIIVEKYYPNEGNVYQASSVATSFSMAKSVTSALLGIAIGEGKVKSVDEPITTYLTELRNGKGFEKITIKHLLNMTSGIKFDETFGINSDLGKLYTTPDILAQVKGLEVERAPGQLLNYQSINTQLLGIIIARATQLPLTQYLQDKIWTPLGMEYDASWSLDRVGGIEKSMCCINARARDFAKFGRLYLKQGNWQGKQIVPAQWVATSITYDPANTYDYAYLYNYQWWFPKTSVTDSTTDFLANGVLEQYIYVSPTKNLIIVKLSNDKLAADGNLENILIMRRIAESF